MINPKVHQPEPAGSAVHETTQTPNDLDQKKIKPKNELGTHREKKSTFLWIYCAVTFVEGNLAALAESREAISSFFLFISFNL